MDSAGKVASAVRWSLLGTLVGQIISFASLIVMLRYVTNEEYGAITVGLLVAETVRVTCFDSVVRGLNSVRSTTDLNASTWFWTVAGCGGLLAGLLALVAALWGMRGGHPALRLVLSATAAVLAIDALAPVPLARLAQGLSFRAIATRNIVSAGAGGGAGITLALLGYGLWSFLAQQFVGAVFLALLGWIFSSWRPGLTWASRPEPSRHVVTNIGLAAALAELSRQIDLLAVGVFASFHDLGLYGLAKKIVVAVTFLAVVPVNRVAMPAFARAATDADRLGQAYLTALRLAGTVMAGFVLLLALMIGPLIGLLLGEQWQPAALLIAILVAGLYAASLDHYSHAVLLVRGRAGLHTVLIAGGTLLNFIILMCVGSHGLVWIAAGFSLSLTLAAAAAMTAAAHLTGLDLRRCADALVPALASALTALGAAMLLRWLDLPFPSGARPFADLICAGAVYVGIVARYDPGALKMLIVGILPVLPPLTHEEAPGTRPSR